MRIIKYELSQDKRGLLAYFYTQKGDLSFYHIHSNELNFAQKIIWWVKSMCPQKMRKPKDAI